MIVLAIRSLRYRVAGSLASFLAMLFGTAIVLACGGVLQTGVEADAPPQRLAASPVVVAGDRAYELPKENPNDAEEDAHSVTLPERNPLDLEAEQIVRETPGVGSAVAEETSETISVWPAEGTQAETLRERLAERLQAHSAVALTGNDRGTAEFPDVAASTENLIIVGAVSGSMALMVALFVMSSTLALSVQQRRREIALLRAIGTTPAQVRRMVVGESLLLGLFASVVGLLPGWLLGHGLFALMSGTVVPEAVQFHLGLVPAMTAIGATLAAALLSALFAARGATTPGPVEALTESSLQRKWLSRPRLLFALLCLGGGLALGIVTIVVMTGPLAQATAGPAVMLFAAGLALLGPGLTKALMAAFRRPVRAVSGVAGYLATVNAGARAISMAAAVTPILLATGVAIANLYLQTTAAAATEDAYTEHLRADAVVNTAEGPLPAGLTEQVRNMSGVATASELVTSTGFVERPYDGYQSEDGTPLQGVSAEGIEQTVQPTLTAGSLQALRGDAVALPTAHAGELGVGVGEDITMRLGDNTAAKLRIVALYDADPGFETILLPADRLAAHTTAGAGSIMIRAEPGTDPEQLVDEIRMSTLGYPGIEVADSEGLGAPYRSGMETQAFVNYLMVGGIVAYTALSVVNTTVLTTLGRRREFGLQRLSGCTVKQVTRMLTVEAGMVAVAGVTLGVLAALGALVPFSLAISGSPFPQGPVWIFLGVTAAASGLAFAATLLPGRSALSDPPARAASPVLG